MSSDAWRAGAERLVNDLRRIFSGRLRSVVAYGPRLDGDEDAPLTCLALVDRLEFADLEACSRVADEWERRELATPLILSEEEFRRSLDAFPLEYGEIVRAHAHVFGDDPFDGIPLSPEDLRRACETQVKSHLVHLREGFIESGNRPGRVADLVSGSAPAFASLLRNIARLGGNAATTRAEATLAGARAAGISDALVQDVLALEQRTGLPTTDAARLFPEYLNAVEQLARMVDRWRV
jgi:hypothetical protein